LLKDDLKQLLRFRYPAAASWRQWFRRALASRLPPLVALAKHLAVPIDGVINHCRYPLHTGLLEGINNKIKVLKGMAYGFRDEAHFFLKIRAAFPGNRPLLGRSSPPAAGRALAPAPASSESPAPVGSRRSRPLPRSTPSRTSVRHLDNMEG